MITQRTDREVLRLLFKDLETMDNTPGFNSRVAQKALDSAAESIQEEIMTIGDIYIDVDSDQDALDQIHDWAMLPEIPNCLHEAYEGFYEEEIPSDLMAVDRAKWIINKINLDNRDQRLAVYTEWNGILGFDGQILSIVDMD